MVLLVRLRVGDIIVNVTILISPLPKQVRYSTISLSDNPELIHGPLLSLGVSLDQNLRTTAIELLTSVEIQEYKNQLEAIIAVSVIVSVTAERAVLDDLLYLFFSHCRNKNEKMVEVICAGSVKYNCRK